MHLPLVSNKILNRQSLRNCTCSITTLVDNFNYINRPTCSLKVSTKFESFSNAALGVHWKCSLDVVHLDSPWCVWTFPKQSIDENLWKDKKKKHHAISHNSQITFTTSQSAIMMSSPRRSGLRVRFSQSNSITQREVLRLQSTAGGRKDHTTRHFNISCLISYDNVCQFNLLGGNLWRECWLF